MELAQIRDRVGYTQEEVAKFVGISRAAYTNIENGKRKPSVSVAKRIGAILCINWTIFFDEQN